MKTLQSYIRDVPDFPKKGIVFKDVTPLLNNARATELCLSHLKELIKHKQIDKIVAIESRGFIFGSLLAQKLGAGLVPVRKAGKLPHATISETYQLEYGTDTLEIHKDAIAKGDRVVIHDDLLATGGTAKACCNLVERLGGHIIQCNFIIELGFLNGAKALQPYNVQSVLQY